jgi:hypothetical protein
MTPKYILHFGELKQIGLNVLYCSLDLKEF